MDFVGMVQPRAISGALPWQGAEKPFRGLLMNGLENRRE